MSRSLVLVELRRFWIEFRKEDAPLGMTAGCGVTAFDHADALRLAAAGADVDLPRPNRIIDDIDISTLDHEVAHNMLPPNERGVWFPMGPYH